MTAPAMDLNELLYQHQRAILVGKRHAQGADPVGHYADRIRRLRAEMGVCAYPA